MKIAIVGAGPCGLGLLRALSAAGALNDDVVCFEKQGDWGGLWNYSWRVGVDAHGEPEHGSMYRFLWSNGPKECLEFADYTFDAHFGRPIPSFPPREVLHDYIIGRAKAAGARKNIRFNTVVRAVEYSAADGMFTVTSEELGDGGKQRREQFENVAVASGHFSSPLVPYYAGMENFPGRILHSHDFRDAGEYSGRNVLVVGGSYSAEDIALQCWKYGAKSVTISYRTSAMGFDWPKGIREVPQITRLDGKTAHFKDGDSADVDGIILCTGYRHHFPFMEQSLRLTTRNRLYPPGLYKGVVWRDNPRLFYLGMQDQYYTFNMFDAQAWVARDIMLGKIAVPPAAAMQADIDGWVKREEALTNPMEDIDFQTAYTRDLCEMTDYPPIDLDKVAAMFKEWEHHKEESIIGYRNQSFESPCTGSKAPVHHTPWHKAMDDSMKSFLATG